MLHVLAAGVVDSKVPDVPGGCHDPAKGAAAEGRPARQGKGAPDRGGSAATDPQPQRQQKHTPPARQPAQSHNSYLKKCTAPVAADAVHAAPQCGLSAEHAAEQADPMEVSSTALQPAAAEPAAPYISGSAMSCEPVGSCAEAALPAVAGKRVRRQKRIAAAAGDAEPEHASVAATSGPVSEGFARKQAGPKQQRAKPTKYGAYQKPGAKTGLLHFCHCAQHVDYTGNGAAMQVLHKKILEAGREDLFDLLEGWTGGREAKSGNSFFRVPDEGTIRSAANTVKYLEDLARLQAGEEPPRGARQFLSIMSFLSCSHTYQAGLRLSDRETGRYSHNKAQHFTASR